MEDRQRLVAINLVDYRKVVTTLDNLTDFTLQGLKDWFIRNHPLTDYKSTHATYEYVGKILNLTTYINEIRIMQIKCII
jgi:hypothetical protein